MSTLWKVSTRNLWLAYRVGMTIRRGRGWAAVGALAIVLTTLSGCGSDTPVEIPTQQPTSTPIFASDEEALAAAQEAYAAYQSTEDTILADGGSNPERIEPFAVRDALKSSLEAAGEFRDKKLHSVGDVTFQFSALQDYSVDAIDGIDVVSAYLCADVSGVDVLDESNTSVVPSSRPERQPFQVSFDLIGTEETKLSLVLATRETWGGDGVCV